MTTQLGFLGYTALQSLVLCAVFVALCDICKRAFRLDDLLAFCAAVVALGVLGYAAFWAAYANYRLFALLKIAVLVVLVIHLGALAWRRRIGDYRWLVEPLLFTFLFFIAVVTLGFSAGGIDDPATTAQNRFSHPLPPDNILPYIVSIALKAGRIPSPMAGEWLASDRPPLQTGLYLLLTLHNHPLGYQIVSSWLQATYLLGAWGLAVAAALPAAARRLTLLACCLLPTAILNTFYVWPKMIAVGYLLLVFALLFCYRPQNDREKALGVLLGGLAALAILSHGTSFFALIAFALVVLAFWAWPSLRTMIAGAATLVLLYVPWILYQQFIDPPGNRLLKWHLAGVIGIDQRGFLTTLRDSYAALSWPDYLRGRMANLEVLVAYWPGHLGNLAQSVVDLDAERARLLSNGDFFHLLLSLHAFAVAVICALLLLPFMSGPLRPQRAMAARLFAAMLAASAIFVVLMFVPGSTLNHQGGYFVHVAAAIFAFTILSLKAPVLALGFIALQIVTVAWLYAVARPHDPAFLPTLLVCGAATAALFAYALHPSVSGRSERRDSA
jgi:hypothetical protein